MTSPKRFFIIFSCFLLTLTACENKDNDNPSASADTNIQAPTPGNQAGTPTPTPTPTPAPAVNLNNLSEAEFIAVLEPGVWRLRVEQTSSGVQANASTQFNNVTTFLTQVLIKDEDGRSSVGLCSYDRRGRSYLNFSRITTTRVFNPIESSEFCRAPQIQRSFDGSTQARIRRSCESGFIENIELTQLSTLEYVRSGQFNFVSDEAGAYTSSFNTCAISQTVNNTLLDLAGNRLQQETSQTVGVAMIANNELINLQLLLTNINQPGTYTLFEEIPLQPRGQVQSATLFIQKSANRNNGQAIQIAEAGTFSISQLSEGRVAGQYRLQGFDDDFIEGMLDIDL